MKKIGNQVPTSSYILPYKKTYGKDAINLYNSTGRTAQKWQENILKDILAYNQDDLFIHTKFGYSVPRRNGKNEIVLIREMWGLKNGERILHTAHRTSTSHMAWERLLDLLEKAGFEIASSYRASGKECIEVLDGGKIEFRTRTSKSGLGEGFDLLVIDEAQEYQDDQESALKYVVSDAVNPQTIFCGTPPTPSSSGMVFSKYRDVVLQGKGVNAAWCEWSVEKECDPHDKEFWYLTNPSLGTILTERKIQDEIGNDDLDFNIQRLGYWVKYSLKSEISKIDWLNLEISKKPKFIGKLFVGIKYGQDGANVAMSIAVKTNDNKVFVEAIGCESIRNGDSWIIEFLKKADIEKVVIDGASRQKILSEEMKDNKLKSPILPTVKEVITANSLFEQAIYGKSLNHNNQKQLSDVVTNCEKRAIGSNGGFGYKSLKPEYEIAIMDSVILAHWICSIHKQPKKQKISY